jgi:hypothetical protein
MISAFRFTADLAVHAADLAVHAADSAAHHAADLAAHHAAHAADSAKSADSAADLTANLADSADSAAANAFFSLGFFKYRFAASIACLGLLSSGKQFSNLSKHPSAKRTAILTLSFLFSGRT